MPVARANTRAFAIQFGRFVLVGLTNTTISVAVFDLLVHARFPYALSGALAFLAGAVNGYVWNRRWTFGVPDCTRARAAYLCVQILGLGATSLLTSILGRVHSLGATTVYLLTVPPVTLAMFVANRNWTFAQGRVSSETACGCRRRPGR
ncbi:MAG: GtrA family protein [Gaiellaceae bacterium]